MSKVADPQNTLDTTVKIGGMAVGLPGQVDCAELDKRNKDDRNNPDSPAAIKGPGTTNTNYSFQSSSPSMPSVQGTSNSRVIAVHHDPSRYCEGIPAQQRRVAASPESNVDCSGATFDYNNCYFKGGHTEARIVETLFMKAAGGGLSGTLTMKIDWQPTSGGESCAPCEHSHALLCQAMQCGVEIVLCTKKNEPVSLADEDCEKDLDIE